MKTFYVLVIKRTKNEDVVIMLAKKRARRVPRAREEIIIGGATTTFAVGASWRRCAKKHRFIVGKTNPPGPAHGLWTVHCWL